MLRVPGELEIVGDRVVVEAWTEVTPVLVLVLVLVLLLV